MVRHLVRCAALAALAFSFVGCAEIDRRGGLVDQVADAVLFRADTKSHRLFRSYVIVGALTTIARHTQMKEVDRTVLSGFLVAALDIVDDAYSCLYPDRAKKVYEAVKNVSQAVCVYFDERMARLDYAIYKLAVQVMFDPESREYIASVRNRMVADIPIVGRGIRAATKVVDAANETAGAVYGTTELVNSLINFSWRSTGTAIYLFPIYRDTLEFDMRLALSMLRDRCKEDPLEELKYRDFVPEPTVYTVAERPAACDLMNYGVWILRDGNGDLSHWRAFLKKLNGDTEPNSNTPLKGSAHLIEAKPLHFAIMSRWIDRGCQVLFPGKPGATPAEIKKNIESKCRPLPEATPLADKPPIYADFQTPERRIEALRGLPPPLAKPTVRDNPNFAAPPTAPLRGTTGSRPAE